MEIAAQMSPRKPSKKEPVWKKFTQAKYHELASLVLALVAILLTVIGFLIDAHQDNEQAASRATQSAFSAAVQATAQYQTELQIQLQQTQAAISQSQSDLQATQTALGLQLADLYRQQAFPYMKTVGPQPFITLSDVTSGLGANGEPLIRGAGTLGLVLANDGGGQAGLVDIRWMTSEDTTRVASLSITETMMPGMGAIVLPVDFEGQSARRLELSLSGEVAPIEDIDGKTEYQLGRLWAEAVQAAQTRLEFQFSNADVLSVPIAGIQLNLPTQAIFPDPPSPFPVTDADNLGQACFVITVGGSPSDQAISGRFVSHESGQQSQRVLIEPDQCLTFPIGEYEAVELTTTLPMMKPPASVLFHVGSDVVPTVEMAFYLPARPLPLILTFVSEHPLVLGILLIILLLAAWLPISAHLGVRHLEVTLLYHGSVVRKDVLRFSWFKPVHQISTPGLGERVFIRSYKDGYLVRSDRGLYDFWQPADTLDRERRVSLTDDMDLLLSQIYPSRGRKNPSEAHEL
jgi:hypothetical protein